MRAVVSVRQGCSIKGGVVGVDDRGAEWLLLFGWKMKLVVVGGVAVDFPTPKQPR